MSIFLAHTEDLSPRLMTPMASRKGYRLTPKQADMLFEYGVDWYESRGIRAWSLLRVLNEFGLEPVVRSALEEALLGEIRGVDVRPPHQTVEAESRRHRSRRAQNLRYKAA